ncbi:MAG: lipoprotein insertase outer membrane protein LolB [Limnohabitans sp.]
MRMRRQWLATWMVVSCCLLLQACATPHRPTTVTRTANEPTLSEWQGRLSVQVHSEPPASMSAAFLLRGNARQGELDLYSPLGNTLGALQWSPQSVQLSQGNARQYFASMAELTEATTGAALPMDALCQWLQGINAPAAGWHADLSSASQGLVTARRITPLPEVSLRIKLD